MAKSKFYVVWKGRKPGIYSNWDDCKTQIFGFEGALYKSFENKQLAETAYKAKPHHFLNKKVIDNNLTPQQIALVGKPIENSITVDGAWSTSTLDIEYQGVHTTTKKVIFKMGPYAEGTNNIAEFLALVHALAYCKHHKLNIPIYSDSRTAISWVKCKKMNSKLEQTSKNAALFDMLNRAEKWLQSNVYPNPILKWETEVWGENPADFGRK